MTRRLFPRSWGRASSPVLVVLMASVASGLDASGDPAPDCEARALAVLLRLEGRRVEPGEVEGRLPEPSPGRGRSMLDLQDAAGASGRSLRGVSLPMTGPVRLDRPALVRLRQQGHDHAVVVRPVGWTGRLVQVIDPREGSRMMDASLLGTLPGWTGRALIPSRPRWAVRVGGGLLLAGAGLVVVRRRSRPEASRPDPGLSSSARIG